MLSWRNLAFRFGGLLCAQVDDAGFDGFVFIQPGRRDTRCLSNRFEGNGALLLNEQGKCRLRRLDRLGYAHFRRWKLYGEETLSRHPAVIWLHGDALTVEYRDTPLAQYTVRYQPDKKHFKAVPEARRFETPYRSLQGQFWELDESLWQLAKRLPDYAPRRKRRTKPEPLQLSLLEDTPPDPPITPE